jgi:hypothetical protein
MPHCPTVLLAFLCLVIGVPKPHAHADSRYQVAPEDPKAITLTPDNFEVRADGVHDDTHGLQTAIDQAGADRCGGVVFVPSGTYLLTDTVNVWPGVRIIGYGPERPSFRLAPRTPGFLKQATTSTCCSSRADAAQARRPAPRRHTGTFYSGMSNVDIEIGAGNHAAVAVRFHVAQHCSLSHMKDRSRRCPRGALGHRQPRRESAHHRRADRDRHRAVRPRLADRSARLHLRGAAQPRRSAHARAGWPSCARDPQHPAAVVMDPDFPDQLWISDGRFEDITGPAIVVSRSANARTQVGLGEHRVPERPRSGSIPGHGSPVRRADAAPTCSIASHTDCTSAERSFASRDHARP